LSVAQGLYGDGVSRVAVQADPHHRIRRVLGLRNAVDFEDDVTDLKPRVLGVGLYPELCDLQGEFLLINAELAFGLLIQRLAPELRKRLQCVRTAASDDVRDAPPLVQLDFDVYRLVL